MRVLRYRPADRGSISVYIAILAVPFLLIAGLVFDGSGALVARQRAADEAEQAARAGANQIDLAALRNLGQRRIDDVLAPAAVDEYFRLAGNAKTYSVQVSHNPEKVTVTVDVNYAPIVLPGFNKAYRAEATAVPLSS